MVINKGFNIFKTSLIISSCLNLILFVIKILFGLFGASNGLIADGVESFGDFLFSIVAIYSIKYIYLPKNDKYPYGYGKIEVLLSIIFAISSFVLSLFVIYRSVYGLKEYHSPPDIKILYIIILVVIVKIFNLNYIKKTLKNIDSSFLICERDHHKYDIIISVITFFGIILSNISTKLYFLDDIAGVIAAIIIFYNSYKIFKNTILELVDFNLISKREDIINISKMIEGVIGVEKCNVRKNGVVYFIDIHIIVDGNLSVSDGHFIGHVLKNKIIYNMPEVSDVLVHVEPDYYEIKQFY